MFFYLLKILFFYIVFILFVVLGLFFTMKTVKAGDYYLSMIGHFVNGSIYRNLNHKKVMKNELSRVIFNSSKDIVIVVEKNLPYILESFPQDIRIFEVEKKRGTFK